MSLPWTMASRIEIFPVKTSIVSVKVRGFPSQRRRRSSTKPPITSSCPRFSRYDGLRLANGYLLEDPSGQATTAPTSLGAQLLLALFEAVHDGHGSLGDDPS